MRTRRPWGLLAPTGLAFLAGLLWVLPAAAAELSANAQQLIRAATFEVVQLKPPDGEVTYEHELPMDLIPYQQRVDKYRSIGTAFAIGPNRYVTAAHVMSSASAASSDRRRCAIPRARSMTSTRYSSFPTTATS